MEKYTTMASKRLIWSSKRFFSALLKMQLCFFNTKSADNVLKQNTETYGSLSSSEYEAIVSNLLEKPNMTNIKRALRFVNSFPLDQRLFSYKVLLNKLNEAIFFMGLNMKCLAMPLINEIFVKANVQDPEHRNLL